MTRTKKPCPPAKARVLSPAVDTETAREKIVINVSGCKFQTWRSTLRKHPGTLLGSADALRRFYDLSRKEYFLDRDPNIFRHVLSYYQVGKLHFSHDDCLGNFYEELDFYGISSDTLHDCCWDNCEELSEEILKNKAIKEAENTKVVTPTNFNKIRKDIWRVFNPETPTFVTQATKYTIASVICLSVLSCILGSIRCTGDGGTVQTLEECYHGVFHVLDWVFMCVFTVEYLLRIYVATDIRAFFKDKINILDLMAILAFYLDVVIFYATPETSTDVLDIFRVLRGIRIIRLARHSKQMQRCGRSLNKAISDLGFLYFAFLLANIFFASLMYTVELMQGYDTFQSIPESMWYCMVTMMTLGYGDMVPRTALGQVVGSFCCLFGIIVLALPVPILQRA